MLNTFQQRKHAMLPKATHDEASRQEFAKSLKQFVQESCCPGLQPVFTRAPRQIRAKPWSRAGGSPRDSPRDGPRSLFPALRVDQSHRAGTAVGIGDQYFDRAPIAGVECARRSACPQLRSRSSKIPEGFQTPRYVTAIDIHCMPGGYAGEVAPDDIATGALYDRGVYLYAMGYMGPQNDDMGRSVCNYIKRKLAGFSPRRILDMGCTVGHSTLPFKELFPDAEVWGIDVAAPQVRYAHARAAGMGLDVNFAQMNAEKTSFAEASFDLVVSHILLHETSSKAMPRIFRECYRLLAPGGYMIHADLPPFDTMDPFTQFILDNETWYNNEPFWGAMREMDQIQLAK